MNIKDEYCGHITIVGQTNVGKSTLLNKIIRKKVSIVSRKKNTTQSNIIGIKTQNYCQFIYIDTPGIIFEKKNHQIQYKKNNFYTITKNSVLVLFVIDRIYWTENDQIIFNKIKKNKIPVVIIINKIDKINNKTVLLPFIDFLQKKIHSTEIVPISAKNMKNIVLLDNIIKSYLQKKNHIYPKHYITTNSQYFTISEIIREQLILRLGDELPSVIKVEIESLYKQSKTVLHIKAIIWVENTRQKGIIIGHNGEKIKKTSIISRKNIEKEFFMKIHLFLWVKNKSFKKNYKVQNN